MIASLEGENGKEFVLRADIPGLLSDELFLSAWVEWNRWKRFGLAHGSGWRDERAIYIRALEICEQEYDLWLDRKMKRD